MTATTEPLVVVRELLAWVGMGLAAGLATEPPEVAAGVVFCWVVLGAAVGVVLELAEGLTF